MTIWSKKIFLSLAAATLVVSIDTAASGWTNEDGPLASAQEGAHKLAELVQTRLKRERSLVVFVSLARCELDDSWCDSFRSLFEHKLVQSGIKFLPEEKREEIRKKISEEGFYQQSSMMVDTTKVVELGKQESFQAFLSITVTGDDQEAFAKVQSVSMRSAAVSISEGVRIRHKDKTTRPVSSYLSALAYTLAGAGVTHLGLDMASKEQARADRSYEQYRASTETADAQKYRKKTEEHDTNVSYAQTTAVIGASVAIYGLYKLFYSRADDYSYRQYKIDKADRRRHAIDPMLVVEDSGSSVGFGLSWNIRR